MHHQKKSLENLNKIETKKAFESFSLLSQKQLKRRFSTSSWDYINKSEMRAVYDLIDFEKDNPLLEVGCGTGRLIIPIKDKMNIYGLDFSQSFLKKIKNQTSKIPLLEGDAEKLPFKNNFFKSVLCVRVIQHLSQKQQQKVIKELARVLHPGGSLIMLNYNGWSLLAVYKMLCIKFFRIWPYWPLKRWKWVIDDYNSFPELKRMFRKAGLKVTRSMGAVVGEPDILRSMKISDFLDQHWPFLINLYYKMCYGAEIIFRNIFPFKYFMGRVVLRGIKI